MPDQGGTGTSEADAGTTSSSQDSSAGASLSMTSGVSESSSSTSEGGSSSSSTGTSGDTVGEGEACNYVMQDCAAGLKCVRVDLDGDQMDERICVAVVEDPLPSGEVCQVNLRTGEDDCSIDSFCVPFFPQDGTGLCTDFCAPIEESLECESAEKGCLLFDDLHYGCFPLCDPLVAECPTGHACLPAYVVDSGFVCAPTHPANDAATGDPCYAQTEGCPPGSWCYQCANETMCLDPLEYGPGCDGEPDLGCCTEYCDLTVGGCSNPFHECLPYFPWASEYYPNAGLCGLPEDFDWCDGTVEDPPLGQCPPADAEPNYPWCSPYDTSACTEGNVNLFGGECGMCWCYDTCASVAECAVPQTGTAEVVCDPAIGCSLLCDQNSDCPNGMNCQFYSGELRCLWQPEGCP